MKTIRIKGTVVYPIAIDQDIKVPNDASMETVKSKMIDIAERFLNDGCVKPTFLTDPVFTEKK